MSTFDEVALSFKLLNKRLKDKVIVLQCTGNYPSSNADSNLNVMQSYKKNLIVFLDTQIIQQDLQIVLLLLSMGANVIEKHFTIDKSDVWALPSNVFVT